jgi:ABC-type multidrug transport system, ATPase and permease components
MKNSKLGLYRRWLGYVGHYKGWMALALCIVVAAISIDLFIPRAFAFVIDRLLSKESLASGRAALPLVGEERLAACFAIVAAVLVCLVAIKACLSFTRTMLLTQVGERIHLELRGALFEKIHHLPMSFFDSSYTGKIMARVTTDTDAVWGLLFNGVNDVVAPLFTFTLVLTAVATTSPELSLVLLVVIPVFVALFFRARKETQRETRLQRETLASIYTQLQEQIAGVRTVRIFGQARKETRKFNHILRVLYIRNVRLMRTFGKLNGLSDFIVGFGTVFVLCFGGFLVSRGDISLGQLVQFYAYTGLLFTPIMTIANTLARTFSQAEVALERIFELMDQREATEFSGGRACPPLSGGVRIENLSFSYDGKEPILQGIDLEIEPRTMAAIVGPSGSGKTSLVNLICRFYDFQEGRILLDGLDLRELEPESFRAQVSYVFQDTFLFSGTIYDNLHYAKPEASREEGIEAAKLANADDFISAFPKGYDTELGERGVNISGGQKQRLSIARALLRRPKLLVMDEPTSALDAESESVILEAMDSVFKGMTRIVIAHRLSTVRNADRIFVLEDGRIVQRGRHEELAAEEGLYRELCQKQFLGYGD